MRLTGDPTRQIVDLLLPHVRTEAARLALVSASWGPTASLGYDIQTGGTPREFAEHFVAQTLKFGRRDGHSAAIDGVLDYLTTVGGLVQQQAVAELRAWLAADPAQLTVPSPYKGLTPYDEADAAFFFGRGALSAQLQQRVVGWQMRPDATRLLAVVGASGSGKSSLVRAGLLPVLRAAGWQIAALRPGSDPLRSLAAVVLPPAADAATGLAAQDGFVARLQSDALTLARWLGRPDVAGNTPPTLLLVDQAEELFTLAPGDTPTLDAARTAFLDNLLAAATQPGGKIGVCLTLRADSYAHYLQHAGLRALLSNHQLLVGPLAVDELREVIEQPAATAGYRIETGLADVILDDLGALGPQTEAGMLPLLSQALLATWQARQGFTLLAADYVAAGGVRQAIRVLAEGAYGALSAEEQAVARTLLLRLADLGANGIGARRSATLKELQFPTHAPALVERVVRVLSGAQARLLVVSQDGSETRIDIAHEALIRAWPRLRGWLQEQRDALRWLARLREAALAWRDQGRDESHLWRGAQLAEAQALRVSPMLPALNALETEFLNAAQTLALAEQAAEKQALAEKLTQAEALNATQQQAVWRLRGVALLLLALVGVLLWRPARAEVARWQARAPLVPVSESHMYEVGSLQPVDRYNELHITIIPIIPAFAIERYEVSNRRYSQCERYGNCGLPATLDRYNDKELSDHPVTGVTAFQAARFCEWIGRRLPTEIEWERAARGPEATSWPWGDASPRAERINATFSEDTQATETKAVDCCVAGRSSEGPDGVYNLVGNVWEWTSSYFVPYSNVYTPEIVWDGDYKLFVEKSQLIVRGMSFEQQFDLTGSNYPITYRSIIPPEDVSNPIGFRCVASQ